MGSWGYLIVGKSDRPLIELAALEPYAAGATRQRPRAGGWQVWNLGIDAQIADSRPLLAALAEETGAPALASFVMAGECASVEAYSASGGHWHTCLARDAMRELMSRDGLDPDLLYLGADEAAERAVRWAADIGVRAEAAKIAEVLRAPAAPFVRELFGRLLGRLGVPAPAGGRTVRSRSVVK